MLLNLRNKLLVIQHLGAAVRRTSGQLIQAVLVLAACDTPSPAPSLPTATAAAPTAQPSTPAAQPSRMPAPPARANERIRTVDGATMLRVEAGAFVRGSSEGDEDESPARTVHVTAFWIDRLEVSVAQYERCVAASACRPPPAAPNKAATAECNWGHADRRDHPVNCVTWQEAVDYCRWAGAALPTEAQWEKAARGSDARRYPWGSEQATCEHTVMPQRGVAGCGRKTTWPVGTKPRDESPFGVRDMSGNVREWVADHYGEKYYATSPDRDPTGPERGWAKTLRGGSWEVHNDQHMRAANRYRFKPDFRFHGAGFRCAGE